MESPRALFANSKVLLRWHNQGVQSQSFCLPNGCNLFREGLSGDTPNSENVVVEQLLVEPTESTLDDMRMISEGELANLHVFAERSKRPNATMCVHMFRKIRIVTSVNSQRLLELRARIENDIGHPEKWGNIVTADYIVLNEENESRLQHHQLWLRTFILIGFCVTPRETRLRRIRRRVCNNSCRQNRNGESCSPTIPWYLVVLAKICVGITTSQPRTDQRPTAECTSALLVRSGLAEDWWREAMECFCSLRIVQDKLADGKSHDERRFFNNTDGTSPIKSRPQQGRRRMKTFSQQKSLHVVARSIVRCSSFSKFCSMHGAFLDQFLALVTARVLLVWKR